VVSKYYMAVVVRPGRAGTPGGVDRGVLPARIGPTDLARKTAKGRFEFEAAFLPSAEPAHTRPGPGTRAGRLKGRVVPPSIGVRAPLSQDGSGDDPSVFAVSVSTHDACGGCAIPLTKDHPPCS